MAASLSFEPKSKDDSFATFSNWFSDSNDSNDPYNVLLQLNIRSNSLDQQRKLELIEILRSHILSNPSLQFGSYKTEYQHKWNTCSDKSVLMFCTRTPFLNAVIRNTFQRWIRDLHAELLLDGECWELNMVLSEILCC